MREERRGACREEGGGQGEKRGGLHGEERRVGHQEERGKGNGEERGWVLGEGRERGFGEWQWEEGEGHWAGNGEWFLEEGGGEGLWEVEDLYNDKLQEVGEETTGQKDTCMSTLGNTNFLIENNLQADLERIVTSCDFGDNMENGREDDKQQEQAEKGRKRKNEATGQQKAKARIVDTEVPDLGSEVPNTLPGSASTENSQTFNPMMFLCQQAIITNNLLESIAAELKNISQHLSNSSQGQHLNSSHSRGIPTSSTTGGFSASDSSKKSSNPSCSPVSQNYVIPNDELLEMKMKSKSPKNFCVIVLRRLFTKEELMNKNFTGSKSADKFDTDKMAVVFGYYYLMYPDPSSRDSDAECKKAITSYCRSLKQPSRLA